MAGLWIIKMTNERILFSPTQSVLYANTNLPKDHFVLKERIQIYWLVELIRVPGNRKEARVRIEDFQFKEIGRFTHQSVLREVPFLRFEEIDKDAFLGFCALYDLPRLEKLFSVSSKAPSANSQGFEVNETAVLQNLNSVPIVREYTEEFRMKFTDGEIVDGAILFVKNLEGTDSNLVFEIRNPTLIKAHNLIKEYLAKKLRKDTVTITATIKYSERKASVAIASSEDIALIDETFIQRIKYKQIKSLLKIGQTDGKAIYGLDELLLQSSELKGNFLQTNIENILDVLTSNGEHRNTKQLAYLAQTQSLDEVVYLTVTPNFGFVFYLQYENGRSYVWELLDSHATYIWIFEKMARDRSTEFNIVENAINEIRQGGRIAYKNKHRDEHTAADYRFHTIQHALEGQTVDKMFVEWLVELNNLIK